MEQEIWKPVVGWEGFYEISSLGRVRTSGKYVDGRVYKDKIKKARKNKFGYYYVNLFRNKKFKSIRIHQLVAQAFIPNPENKPCIDHIDTNRENNRVENLRWCTYAENANNHLTKQHLSEALKKACSSEKVREQRRINAKKYEKQRLAPIVVGVSQFTKDGVFIKSFYSASDAAREMGGNCTSIIRCCKGKKPTAYGFIWKYTN